jgi:plasmid stability protein
MATLTIRKLDDDLVRRLKIRAAENGRSAEAEVRAILERDLRFKSDDFRERAAAMRAELAGRYFGDSAEIIREQREARTRSLMGLDDDETA